MQSNASEGQKPTDRVYRHQFVWSTIHSATKVHRDGTCGYLRLSETLTHGPWSQSPPDRGLCRACDPCFTHQAPVRYRFGERADLSGVAVSDATEPADRPASRSQLVKESLDDAAPAGWEDSA